MTKLEKQTVKILRECANAIMDEVEANIDADHPLIKAHELTAKKARRLVERIEAGGR